MSDSVHQKKNGSWTVIGKNGIKGNIPSEKAKTAPTAGSNATAEVNSRSRMRRIAILNGEPIPEFSNSTPLDDSTSIKIPKNIKSAIDLRARLETVWNEETSAGGYTPELPSTGQCAITALIVQDLLGGELLRTINMDISHYFNRLQDGTEIDLTRDQFSTWDPEPFVVKERAYLEKSEWTMSRYKLLCSRLDLPTQSI